MKPNKSFKIIPKNSEQKTAIDDLTNTDVDLVIMEGVAGSGKTFLALAAGLGQVLDYRTYKEIIFTRAPVGVGVDMGFLPGDEQDKLGPWCGALFDNVGSLLGDDELTLSYVQSKIKIKAMQFMRGRNLINKYLIIDEVQNLSLQELKVLLTRAGEGTKVILLGDCTQIDNKKLNADSNALTQIINFYNYCEVDYVKHIKLAECERSRLCKWASEIS